MDTKNLMLMVGLLSALACLPAHAADLAKVNGKAITDRDMQIALSSVNDGQRQTMLKDPAARKQILSGLIDQEILASQAEKEKLDQEQDFRDAMAAFKRQYLVNKLLERNLAASLSDKAAKKYYEEHKNTFTTDQIEVEHILLDDEAKAREMLKTVKLATTDFQEQAEKFSKDPSAKNNRGVIGVVTHDSPFVDEFKRAAFAAKEGEIVGPVRTQFGYHIIKVTKKKYGRALGYDEVELKVKNNLKQELIKDYVTKLKAQAKVQVDEKALGSL